ncbi:hypothetical protein BU14_0178s0022 [Porphyra umbilicalis]|uniref:Protein phosphatase n=1 Tax=Porphyra umbilicalis TaxID=2786 RepID=A0A1X6P7G0_PORUM|nr:hypothetical protein BU14_0178s0022 [Porphyra umbilicalis]|eukprot:OSX76706.1 hypothetical protein BU14_0178s0022 [Porphyra umbilicalis]
MAFVSVAVPRTGAAPNVRAVGLRTCGLTSPAGRPARTGSGIPLPLLVPTTGPAAVSGRFALRMLGGLSLPPFPFFKNKEDPNRVPLSLECGYVFLAHPEKQTGEDAFFIEGNALGVFDGVGGSANRGVDPRLFSQSLAALTAERVAERGADKVVACLISAVEANPMAGASTAVVVGLDNVGRVFGVSLGDSGARIIRNGKVICRSKDQAHAFNAPYQLSDLDVSDTVAMGSNISSRVKEGDVLVLASDGLFDNVEEPELLALIAAADGDMVVAAETLGSTASDLSRRQDIDSPFAKAARKAGVRWRGGKMDDVTVLTARVVRDPENPALSVLSLLPEKGTEPDEDALVEM